MAEQNIKLSDLKKSDVKMKKRENLSDDELGKISGGYLEYQGYASGYWIQCPNCGGSDLSNFNSYSDHSQAIDVFICKCGKTFAVDTNGDYYM